jgi:acyl phosphate:glycerol-3-phosphate acyltransferase
MTVDPMTALAVAPLAGYLAGSIPFGMIIARAHGVDLRKTGSGNVGATNVGRVLGKKWGYACFLLDVAKGLLPALAAVLLVHPEPGQMPTSLQQAVWLSAGLGAILGHVFTFWLGFRGGKGVATALGVVLGIYPYFTWAGLCAFAIWIAVTLVSRYVSLGSIVAAAAFLPLFAMFNGWQIGQYWPLAVFATAMMGLIVIRHRTNIRRLIDGTENKIGRKVD